MNTVIAPEYHHLAFGYLDTRHKEDLYDALITNPERLRAEFFVSKLGADDEVIITPKILKEWLSLLENKMEEKLHSHSPFFWIYLYRRIRPALHPHHSNKTDDITVYLVREIAELAMLKYGDISITSDINRTSQYHFIKAGVDFWREQLRRSPRNAEKNLES